MNKRQQLVSDMDESLANTDMNDIFDRLDTYHIKPPPMAATNQLIQNLKPVFKQERLGVNQGQRFRDIMEDKRSQNGIPIILQLVGSQTALIDRGFVTLTIIFLIFGLLLANIFESSSSKFLVTASPFLGLLTLFYEYRAQLYKVEEMEGTCHYSPAQVAVARILVVLVYNVVLCTAATLMIESSFSLLIGHLMINWLAPLLLIVGIALFTSLKFGITGGCMTAGAIWTAQLTLVGGDSFLHFFLPGLPNLVTDVVSIFLGIGLLYFSLCIWQRSERFI
ncbi:hypothetical protein [Pelosinus sp. sgz500959]|uniref:hypothetical protein n=1 Tax=Pelosinus sp. sgz500959 TaxID=3242472 RepID=UPI00366DF1A9